MSDSRFHLKVEFEIYGEKFPWDASLNWHDDGDGIDQRIFEFFRDAHDKAYAKFQKEIYESAMHEYMKQKEKEEREMLAKLKAKYEGGV